MGCPSSPISFTCLNFFKVQGAKKMPQPNLGFTSLAKHGSAAKFLPSYLNYSPPGSAVCLWQRQWEILSVGSTEPGHLLQSASTPPAPPIDIRENIPASSFSCSLWTFYPLIPLYLLIPFASPLLCFKMLSYRLHWVPHNCDILQFGKQQLCIPFIKSWRQWIDLDHILEVSACPVGSKLQTCSLSGLSI